MVGGSNGRLTSKLSREKNVIENQQNTKERPRRDSISIYPPSSPGRSLLSVKGENENCRGYVESDFFGGSMKEDSDFTTVKVKNEEVMDVGDGGESDAERVASQRRHSLNYPFPAFLAPRALIRYPPTFVDDPNDGR